VTDFDTDILAAAHELSNIGFGVHWLHRKQKRPIGKDWSDAPVPNALQLATSQQTGNNLGVRLGEPSRLLNGTYLHVIDVDIRVADLVEDALAALEELLPGAHATLPMVRSGSGGASFHLYFVCDKAFRSKKLAQSDGKFRGDDGSWHRDWELELFGTGKQVVLPPSIHPSGKPYVWVRPFDEFALQFDDAYQIPSETLSRLAVPDDTHYEYETVSPLDFKPGRMEALLDDVRVSDLDYDDWLRLGQALHHQLGGTAEGFNLWLKHTERSDKHDGKNTTVRTMRMKWRSFGKYRGRPVTMATISQWAQAARADAMADEFEDLEDLDDTSGQRDADDFEGIFDNSVDAGPAADGGDDDATPGTADAEPALKWSSLLDYNEDGGIKGTLHNITLIVENDPRTKGIIRKNVFGEKLVQLGTPGTKKSRKQAAKPTLQLATEIWKVRDPINGDPWNDDRDSLLRRMIEAPKTQGGYGLKVTDRDLSSAITIVGANHVFHPVRDYLAAIRWDGKLRMESLFIDYIGTPDNAYYRQIARLFLIAAVARVFEPGHKFDYVPIIEGMQGRRKSTFIKILGKHWSSELDGDFADDRAMIEKMLGSWISELPELSAFNKAEVNHIKAFVSRQEDRARLAYDRRVTIFLRQCVFMGSTNDRKYLKDETGGRRFWPVECNMGPNEEINTERLEAEIDQIWGEAYAAYLAMRAAQPRGALPLYLKDKQAAEIALVLQESRRIETTADVLSGRIQEWLNRPVYTGDISDGGSAQRMITCCAEIWKECMKGDDKYYDTKQQYAIASAMRKIPGWVQSGSHRFTDYGKQRAYVRETTSA
jgi:predicted P-loop ATPase